MDKNPDPTSKEEPVLTELRNSGKKIIDLGAGAVPRYKEDWTEGCISKVATECLVEAAKEEWGAYPLLSADLGIKENAIYNLRQAIASFLKKYNGVDATLDDVMIGHGTSGCFAIMHLALLNPGDEMLSVEPSHYLVGEFKTVLMLQGNIVTAPSDPHRGWEPDFDALRCRITDRTKAIVVTQPTNPTGVIYSEKTLKQFVDIAGEHGLPVISDEMYQLITYDRLEAKSIVSVSGDVPVVITGSTSKFFRKPGWCVGYASFHDPAGKMEEFKKAAFMVSSTVGFGGTRVATPILVAAARMYSDEKGIDECFRWVRSLQAKRDFICKRINQIEGLSIVPPQAAFYGLFRVEEIGKKNSRWRDDYQFALEILKREGLRVFAAQKFGKSAFGCVRVLMYRKMSILEEALNKLEDFMKTSK
jgi:aspartate/methionine/tyrosine aminotransferase